MKKKIKFLKLKSNRIRAYNFRLPAHYGFTLIELLVTISIMILLVIFFIPQYQAFSRRNELRMTLQEMKEKVLQAQSFSLAPRDADKGVTYYRFVFYPNNPNGIKYEIRSGDYDLTKNPQNQTLTEIVVDQGYFSKNISYKSGSGELYNINNQNQGTFVFQVISGNCNYWHTQSPATYTFYNIVNETDSLNLDLSSCKVSTSL